MLPFYTHTTLVKIMLKVQSQKRIPVLWSATRFLKLFVLSFLNYFEFHIPLYIFMECKKNRALILFFFIALAYGKSERLKLLSSIIFTSNVGACSTSILIWVDHMLKSIVGIELKTWHENNFCSRSSMTIKWIDLSWLLGK